MNLRQKILLSSNIIEKAISEYSNRIFMSFSGGKDSTVLFDLVRQVKPDIKIVGIDTGFEFSETIEFTDKLMKKHNTQIEYLRPTVKQSQEILDGYFEKIIGESVDNEKFVSQEISYHIEPGKEMKDGQWYCCAHKEPALRNFLEKGEYDAWLTGLRSDETENRKNIGIYQKGKNGIQKINPIIFWTKANVWQYVKSHRLEYHPKYDQGYKSLGCKPCTEAGLREGKGMQSKFEDVGLSGERSNASECGLHL